MSRTRTVGVVGSAAALAGALVATVALVAADLPSAWDWLLGGLAATSVLLGGSSLATLLGRTGTLRLRHTGDSVVVLGAAWARAVDVGVAVVLTVALVGGLLELGSTDPAVAATPGTGAAVAVALLAVLAALAFWRCVGVVARRRRGTRLQLRPDGLEVSSPGGHERFAWNDLTGVDDHPLSLQGHAGTSVPLPARELRSDPALVARLVEHYRAHPEHRGELADGRALQRADEGRLAD